MADDLPYRPFDGAGDEPLGSVGWDAWAEEYAALPRTSAAYRLSRELLYRVLDEELRGRARGLDVLDFNCGCGNDFPYFLDRGHNVVGCDGSAGMLMVAARRFSVEIGSGRVTLFRGRAEALTPESFQGRRFDVVFCGTGSVAYLSDPQLVELHRTLTALSKPTGLLVATHLRPACLGESLYYLAQLRPRAAARRWRASLKVTIRGEDHVMYLRGARRLESILGGVCPPDRLVALNVLTPPFQTGVQLSDDAAGRLLKLETALQRMPGSLGVCDQVVWITRRP